MPWLLKPSCRLKHTPFPVGLFAVIRAEKKDETAFFRTY